MSSCYCSGDEIFAEAQQRWRLTLLYTDLTAAKGQGLTQVEKTYLRGLLCGYSPNEIAQRRQVKSDSVRNTLSKGLYRYIEALLSPEGQDPIRVESWGQVPRLLAQAGYALSGSAESDSVLIDQISGDGALAMPQQDASPAPLVGASGPHRRWVSGLPDVQEFYGRETDLALLKAWVMHDRCRIVLLLGAGGIGKTALAMSFLQGAQGEFEYVVWRSLRNAPEPEALFRDLNTHLWAQASEHPVKEGDDLSLLLQFMQRYRCLIVLEDIQAIFTRGELVGAYAEGYAAYGELLRRVGEEAHQSCLLLTSWEKPREVARLEKPGGAVRSHGLKGLSITAARELLRHQHLQDEDAWEDLIRPYRGNPLALKVVGTTIHDLFAGSVDAFLGQNTLFLGDLAYLLDQQLKRLSTVEQEIVAHLAAQPLPISLAAFKDQIPTQRPWSTWLAALESLARRSMLERSRDNDRILLSLQPVLMKYILSQEVRRP